ncbi:MAG: hypothetical protein ABGZ17_11025 [Planctomycetaceae bacterium]
MRPRLRLFTGEDALETVEPEQVSVPLAEIANLLVDAAKSDRTWLIDFRDDEVKLSADLYEVLSAYSHLRPSA